MAIITNTHKTALSLPGITLQPNTQTPVHNWDHLSKNAVVSAWVKAGVLKVDDAFAGDQGSKFVQPDKAEVMAKLDALGVTYTKQTGVAKLQVLLGEAEAQEAKDAKLREDARLASGLDHDAWDALSVEERQVHIDKLSETQV